MNRRSRFAIGALAFGLLFLAGCGSWGKHNPYAPQTPADHDTCYTCPPDSCPTCPPDTTYVEVSQYATASGRVHEAQSHAMLVTGVSIPAGTILKLRLPVEYEDKQSQQNENFHIYIRSTADFTEKFDFIWDGGTTEVVPDPAGFTGWLTRGLRLSDIPSGTYDVVLQQDLPNHYSPGESDIRFGPGTLTIYTKK